MVPTVKSIILNPREAKAYAAGTLTQLRRVCKPQPVEFVQTTTVHAPKHPAPYMDSYCSEPKTVSNPRGMSNLWCWWTTDNRPDCNFIKCPYGKPGDQLALREGFWIEHEFADSDYGYGADLGPCLELEREIQYCASPEYLNPPKDGQQVTPYNEFKPGRWWLAPPDDWCGGRDYTGEGVWEFLPWGPHSKIPAQRAPLWTVRHYPTIKSVRLERIQDISEEEARACGFDGNCQVGYIPTYQAGPCVYHYATYFNCTNRSIRWESNPWVWVYDVEGSTK